MKKIGIICLLLLLAMGSLGINYASWSKNLTISGTMVTATDLGDTTIETNAGTRNTGFIEAWDEFSTTKSYTITAFMLYQRLTGGNGNMHVGLYSGTATAPTTLVTGSDSGSLTVSSATGWVTYYYSTPFTLPAGTYWIVFTFSSTTLPGGWNARNTTGTHIYKSGFTFGALPASWPSGSTTETNGPTSMYFIGY
jgi:hypothetical protein